jgi:hypothetical protein
MGIGYLSRRYDLGSDVIADRCVWFSRSSLARVETRRCLPIFEVRAYRGCVICAGAEADISGTHRALSTHLSQESFQAAGEIAPCRCFQR